MDIIRTHGIGGYNAGCRCDICREAKSIKRKQYRTEDSLKKEQEYKKLYSSLPENKQRKSNYDKDRHKRIYNPSKDRWKNILRKYKLTQEQYEAMLIEQNGECAICFKKPNRYYLSVDHDHACCPGQKTCGNCIRGLLCQSCNSFLGRVDDNLTSAIKYLVGTKGGDANA
jgi:hypothetical protein